MICSTIVTASQRFGVMKLDLAVATAVDVHAAPSETQHAGIDVAFQVTRQLIKIRDIMRAISFVAGDAPMSAMHKLQLIAGSAGLPMELKHVLHYGSKLNNPSQPLPRPV